MKNIKLIDILTEGHRPINVIAAEIDRDWQKVSPYARPYLDAMYSLNKITDRYHMDSGSSVVAYFLSNANTWKGETAKRIKAELKQMLKR